MYILWTLDYYKNYIPFRRALVELQDEPSKQSQSSVSNSYELPDDEIVHGRLPGDMSVDRIKSAISVVQEIAQKRDLPIRFMVESETGPAHMKHFIIKCSVGEIEVSFFFSSFPCQFLTH